MQRGKWFGSNGPLEFQGLFVSIHGLLRIVGPPWLRCMKQGKDKLTSNSFFPLREFHRPAFDDLGPRGGSRLASMTHATVNADGGSDRAASVAEQELAIVQQAASVSQSEFNERARTSAISFLMGDDVVPIVLFRAALCGQLGLVRQLLHVSSHEFDEEQIVACANGMPPKYRIIEVASGFLISLWERSVDTIMFGDSLGRTLPFRGRTQDNQHRAFKLIARFGWAMFLSMFSLWQSFLLRIFSCCIRFILFLLRPRS